jgi:hypothetical protein
MIRIDGVLVEVLHRDRAAGPDQVMAAVLEQRVHRHDEEAGERADQHQQDHRQPELADEVHDDDDNAHGDAERDDAHRAVERDPQRGEHRADSDADRGHALQHRRLGKIVAQRGARPFDDDELAASRPRPRRAS